jgi:hypothetical protein
MAVSARDLEHQKSLALRALLTGPQSRESIDRICRASNGPAVIAKLKNDHALGVATELVPFVAQGGRWSRYGVYHLHQTSRNAARELLARWAKDALTAAEINAGAPRGKQEKNQ